MVKKYGKNGKKIWVISYDHYGNEFDKTFSQLLRSANIHFFFAAAIEVAMKFVLRQES